MNNESFLRWLRGNAMPEEKAEWERWLLKDPGHRRVVAKAYKFLTMPFNAIPDTSDKAEQLRRLRARVSEQAKDSEAAEDEN